MRGYLENGTGREMKLKKIEITEKTLYEPPWMPLTSNFLSFLGIFFLFNRSLRLSSLVEYIF